MVPIFLNAKGGPEGYSFDEFGRKFEAICHAHHKEGRALAFAFILYDFEHAEIAKVLHDDDYWNALNKISGKYLTVFSFHLVKRHRGVARSTSRVGRSSSGSFNDSKQFISERFGAELPSVKPVILFFQVTGDKISDPCVVEVRAETVEKAFIEIRSILSDAVESVERVSPEFRGNTAEIFNLIVTRLQQRKAALFIKKAVGVAGSVHDLAGRLKGF